MRVKTQQSSEREMQLTFNFDRDDLRLEYSLIGVVVHLTDCPTVGEPGGPALPTYAARVALPAGSRLIDVQTEAADAVRVSDAWLPIAPLQPTRPGIIDRPDNKDIPPYRRPDEEQRDHPRKLPDQRQDEEPSVEAFPTPVFVLPDPELFAEAVRRPIARLRETTQEGLTPVATIHLNPVRLTADGGLEFSPQIELTLRLEPSGTSGERVGPAGITSRAQAMRQVALTRRGVLNPAGVFDYSDLYPYFNLGTDYLVITDNQHWDAQTMSATGPAGGDLAASFESLAAWKRQRGLKARVVTISEIVADNYGNFRTGSRDLQEVIRKFLKMAQADWGVAWVLLGGDASIVPVRWAAGSREGAVDRQATNPPPANTSFWTGSYLRVHADGPGTWFEQATTNFLVRRDTGLLIPYDAAGTSNATTRGWYFTTDDTYGTRQATPSDFVRVNGPASQVNADLQFLYMWNMIPTDLYYSSLVGPNYNQPGVHDWDLLDNGVYGQHSATGELDGINYTPTVSLGRAPVGTAAQADAFVNKVIAYEKFERPDGTLLDNAWTRRLVLASENWGGRLGIGATASSPPGDNQYHHTAGESHSLIKLKDTPDWNWSLLAVVSETEVRLLPYRTDAAAAGRGWYFAGSSTDLSPNIFWFSWSGTLVGLPLPSQWIAVYGTAQELAPGSYLFNSTELDGSLADQEQLRLQMRSEMPGFNDMERLYEDIEDMTPAQVSAGPLELITTNRLRDALNEGPHIVSLSGHGNSNGCCKLTRSMADGLTNGYHTFIAYADSCLTNQFDADAASEHLLRNANGGAVAYIGNTRFSWISMGDNIQRRFFHEWSTLGGDAHLGLLNDTRSSLLGSFYWADERWGMMALHLMGDPEMPLWWREPLRFRNPQVFRIDKLRVIIDLPDPPPFPIDAPYDKMWNVTYVHLRQGGQEQVTLAGADGSAEIPLTDFKSGAATLTVARAGHQPLVQEVQLVKSGEGRGCNPLGWLMRLLRRRPTTTQEKGNRSLQGGGG
jgi:hypothetical protein